MRLTPRLILPTLLVLSLTACKGDGDDVPVEDSPLTDDSDSDSDSQPQLEDCFTVGDEEQDGLADCADDDCLDVCVEDCSDTIDNDADGAIDCDDDECIGAEGCAALYNVTARIVAEPIRLFWGPGVIHEVGLYAIGLFTGSVKLDGKPVDASGERFTCSGNIYAYPSTYNPGYGALDYVGGDCDGCDFRMEMTTTIENGGISWRGKCPVTELPFAELGFFTDRDEVTRYDPTSATWAPHYRSIYAFQYTLDYGYGLIYVSYMGGNAQLNPVVWEASL